jgi:lipid-binding SYLF domain-containing protein
LPLRWASQVAVPPVRPRARAAPQTKEQLESQSTAALNRLYEAMPGTRELVAKSRGVLVCPAVIGGSFVIGAEHGKCVLRANGTTRGYYSTTAASIGWQAGGASKAVIYVFSSQDAYNKFLNSDGWSVGPMPMWPWARPVPMAVSTPPRPTRRSAAMC